jgi:hypothetical protein
LAKEEPVSGSVAHKAVAREAVELIAVAGQRLRVFRRRCASTGFPIDFLGLASRQSRVFRRRRVGNSVGFLRAAIVPVRVFCWRLARRRVDPSEWQCQGSHEPGLVMYCHGSSHIKLSDSGGVLEGPNQRSRD